MKKEHSYNQNSSIISLNIVNLFCKLEWQNTEAEHSLQRNRLVGRPCLTFKICPGGGIGRRTRLKIVRRKSWEFDSPPGHRK